jgi:hypothetical protein
MEPSGMAFSPLATVLLGLALFKPLHVLLKQRKPDEIVIVQINPGGFPYFDKQPKTGIRDQRTNLGAFSRSTMKWAFLDSINRRIPVIVRVL